MFYSLHTGGKEPDFGFYPIFDRSFPAKCKPRFQFAMAPSASVAEKAYDYGTLLLCAWAGIETAGLFLYDDRSRTVLKEENIKAFGVLVERFFDPGNTCRRVPARSSLVRFCPPALLPERARREPMYRKRFLDFFYVYVLFAKLSERQGLALRRFPEKGLGVVATRRLSGALTCLVGLTRKISKAESERLERLNKGQSLLLRPRPGDRDGSDYYMLFGPVSWLNHSCEKHANAYPDQSLPWTDDGSSGFSAVSLQRVVEPGEELTIFYSEELAESYRCSFCS